MFYKKIKTRDAFLHLEESTLGVKAHDCVVIKIARQGQLVDLYRPLNIYLHVTNGDSRYIKHFKWIT